jgi:hypothetical protein
MFTSFQVAYPVQSLVVSGVVAALLTTWFIRWYRRSPQLHFGAVGTVILAAIVFVALVVGVFFGVL